MQNLSDLATDSRCDGTVDALCSSPRERLRRLVAGILASKSPAAAFSDEDTLAEIGIASVDMVTLLLSVESEFDVEVPQHEITAEVFRSISTIDTLIQRLLPQAALA